MKVRSAILTEMSGKLGGAVAATSRGGVQYFRKLVIPSNPRSFLQTAIRQAVASAASYWRNTLDEAHRDLWWDLATGSQTGSTLFARVNQPRAFAANANLYRTIVGAISVPPLEILLESPPASLSNDFTPGTVVIDDSANTLTLSGLVDSGTWYGTPTDDAQALVYIYASHQQSPSRQSRQHPYRLLGAVRIALDETPSDINAVINLAALDMSTAAGNVMYIKQIGQGPTGSISVPVESRVTIVA